MIEIVDLLPPKMIAWSEMASYDKETRPDPTLQVRRQLIRLLERRRFVLPKFSEMPYDWRPEQVTNPSDGQPFTRNGACQLIREKLEAGCLIEAIVLDIPYGKTAYEMVIDLGPKLPDLYVKLQLGSAHVIGRSFHYSTKPKRTSQ